MKKILPVLSLLIASFLLVQCSQVQDDPQQHMMSEGQMGQMMQNPEQRQAFLTRMMQNSEHRHAMMAQIAANPDMRADFMNHMQTSMMNTNQDQMIDRMESIMNNPEQRDLMRTQMQNMLEVLDSDTLDHDQMRQMLDQSPMMGMSMSCMQMTMSNIQMQPNP